MWLYPIPAVAAIIGWAALFLATGKVFVLGGLAMIALGVLTYLARARWQHEWPFPQSVALGADRQSPASS
jgi:hypothetical protein